jgi:hypothetical protein
MTSERLIEPFASFCGLVAGLYLPELASVSNAVTSPSKIGEVRNWLWTEQKVPTRQFLPGARGHQAKQARSHKTYR